MTTYVVYFMCVTDSPSPNQMFHLLKKIILKDIVLEVKDIRSLAHLRVLYDGYIPWTGASIHPTALVYVLNDILLHRRQHIIECGSGISTLFIAQLIKNHGLNTTFCSIDHNEGWIELMRKQMKANGTEAFVNFIHAPLVPITDGWKGPSSWYDIGAIEKQLSADLIDLLFVDGPPANDGRNPYSRFPAVPFFYDRLDENATIILDDSCRKAERRIAARWNRTYGLRLKQSILKGDIFLHTRNNQFNVL
jgi:hypothetical protein